MLLLKNISYLVTANSSNQIIKNTSLLIENNLIKEINTSKKSADEIIDAEGMIVIPGLINCHHHTFQCLLRGRNDLQNKPINEWINTVCNITKKMNNEIFYYSALANMAELLLYGCTTTTDMPYIVHNNNEDVFEQVLKAAKDISIRILLYRGSMSLSKKDGALFPDDVVQESEKIAKSSEYLIKNYHDNSPFAMQQIGLAPCNIFTSSQKDFENASKISQKYNVLMQTHLSESEVENNYSLKKYHKRPLAYLQGFNWSGKKTSFAHCINVDEQEIDSLKKNKSNVVYCPISNSRQPVGEFGIAPIYKMLKNRVNVGIGVDGSAGNDSSNLLDDLRFGRVIQGADKQSTYLSFEDTLRMGTINGAKLLNRENEIGSIEEGKAADLALFNLNDNVEVTGTFLNPLSFLFANHTKRANFVIVNGKIVVRNGKLTTFREKLILKKLKKLSKQFMN